MYMWRTNAVLEGSVRGVFPCMKLYSSYASPHFLQCSCNSVYFLCNNYVSFFSSAVHCIARVLSMLYCIYPHHLILYFIYPYHPIVLYLFTSPPCNSSLLYYVTCHICSQCNSFFSPSMSTPLSAHHRDFTINPT